MNDNPYLDLANQGSGSDPWNVLIHSGTGWSYWSANIGLVLLVGLAFVVVRWGPLARRIKQVRGAADLTRWLVVGLVSVGVFLVSVPNKLMLSLIMGETVAGFSLVFLLMGVLSWPVRAQAEAYRDRLRARNG